MEKELNKELEKVYVKKLKSEDTKKTTNDKVELNQEPESVDKVEITQEAESIDKIARLKDANQIVTNHMLFAVGFGSVPVPMLDLLGLTATQLNMLKKLSELYGENFIDDMAKKSIASLIGGSLSIPVAMGVSSIIKFIPVIGQSAGALSIASIGSASTYGVGKVFIEHFESGGTLLDFDANKTKEYFKKEFEKGKSLVKNLKKENITIKDEKVSE